MIVALLASALLVSSVIYSVGAHSLFDLMYVVAFSMIIVGLLVAGIAQAFSSGD